MTTPYRHVPPVLTEGEARQDDGTIVLVRGREKRVAVDTLRQPSVLHHGANPDQKELLSGELRCTLTALSPLLVANRAVAVGDLTDDLGRGLGQLGATFCNTLRQLAEQLPQGNKSELGVRQKALDEVNNRSRDFSEKKKVLFPLQWGSSADAPVVLPGESLKGMLAHVLASLCGAPLAGVDEAAFSYRPNATLPPTEDALRTIPIAGRVIATMTAGCLALKVEPIVDLGDIEWVLRSKLPRSTDGITYSPGDSIPARTSFCGKDRQRIKGRWKWMDNHVGTATTPARCRLLQVRYGLNNGAVKAVDHPQALIPERLFVGGNLVVPEPVVRQFLTSREHVGTRHPLPQQDDLIFLELLLPGQKSYGDACRELRSGAIALNKCHVISCGQNYRYRWRYVDSVCQVARGWNTVTGRWEPQTRAEFDPWREAGAGRVDALQNMFGYTLPELEKVPGDRPQGAPAAAGEGVPLPPALAGRISINAALERVAADSKLADRFVCGHAKNLVFLQPLASPKGPSWEEGYVPCNTGTQLATLGNGIRVVNGTVAGRPEQRIKIQHLATGAFGRKHYLHHEATLGSAGLAGGKTHFDLEAFIEAREMIDRGMLRDRISRRLPLVSEQAGIAARVSRPGSEFGMTIRFKDLRPGELGLLILALCPGLAGPALDKLEDRQRYAEARKVCASVRKVVLAQERQFGLRLGHGKPLGMGSVAINIDTALFWDDETSSFAPVEYVVRALEENGCIPEATLAATLGVLRLDSDAQSYLSQELQPGGQPELKRAQKIRSERSEFSRMEGF
jgi:hypothetical protein